MNRVAIGFLVCALALGVVGWRWLAAGDGARESFSNPSLEGAGDAVDASSFGLQSPERDTSTARTVAAPQDQPGTETLPLKLFAAPALEPATLIVRVVDRRTARGLAALPVSIDTLEKTRTHTDLQGMATLQLPPNVEWRLRVRPNNYHNVYEQRSVPPLAPGERRELVVEASLMERESFFARVLDAETRLPVPEARVCVGSEAAVLARSDVEGVFDIPIAVDRPAFLRISATGHADLSISTRPGCDSRMSACEVLLARSAVLIVRLEGMPQAAWSTYRVSCTSALQPDNSGPIAVQLGALDLFAPREAPCDAQGVVRIEGLPSNLALVVRVSHDGKQLPLRLPSLQLSAGESRELVVDLEGGCQLRGRTVDPSGVPVGGVSIWLMPLIPDANPVAGFLDARRVTASTTSNDQGRFVIDGVAPGFWQLSPSAGDIQFLETPPRGTSQEATALIFRKSERPSGGATTQLGRNDVAPWIQDITVPTGARSFDLDLVVHCGRYIKGRVVDVRGNPAQGVSVFACDSDLQDSVNTNADGKFSLGPLGPGDFQVWARDVFNARGFAAPQAAAVGAGDVLLELRPAGKLLLLYGGAAPTARYSVLQDKVEVLRGSLTRGVSVRLSLPQGLLSVELMPERSNTKCVREIEVSASEERELTLRDGE